MTGEGQFFGGGEDANLKGAVGLRCPPDIGRLGEIELAREGHHIRVGHLVIVYHNPERIATEPAFGEDVDDVNLTRHEKSRVCQQTSSQRQG